MRHLTAIGLAVGATGCTLEKDPPQVEWLLPQGPVTVTEGDALGLRFTVSDPAPVRGRTTPAEWRITIGPPGGGTWWTTAGQLADAPGEATVRDTVEATWQVPGWSATGTLSGDPLVFSAIVTDGAGQTGADFVEGIVETVPLTSSGLWWVDTGSTSGWHHLDPAESAIPQYHPSDPTGNHVVHCDGASLLVTGGDIITAWPLVDGVPSDQPAWTVQGPPSAAPGGLRYLRKTPMDHVTAAWVEAGWADRCVWYNPSGSTMRSWILEADEVLIDAGVIGGAMVILARTSAQDLRMVRFHLDNSARIGSVTWTPEAPGSLGADGRAWLLEWSLGPAALEADGVLRQWNPSGGAAPITTTSTSGTGMVQAAGRTETGLNWAARDQTHFTGADGEPVAVLTDGVHATAFDRAGGILWVLAGSGSARNWTARDMADLSALTTGTPAGMGATGGSIAHNRPGPL